MQIISIKVKEEEMEEGESTIISTIRGHIKIDKGLRVAIEEAQESQGSQENPDHLRKRST
jgi:hypothetical protein